MVFSGRAGKKDAVTGSVKFSYSYLTHEKEKILKDAAEAEEKRKREELLAKREEERKAREKAVDELMGEIPTAEGANLAALREVRRLLRSLLPGAG